MEDTKRVLNFLSNSNKVRGFLLLGEPIEINISDNYFSVKTKDDIGFLVNIKKSLLGNKIEYRNLAPKESIDTVYKTFEELNLPAKYKVMFDTILDLEHFRELNQEDIKYSYSELIHPEVQTKNHYLYDKDKGCWEVPDHVSTYSVWKIADKFNLQVKDQEMDNMKSIEDFEQTFGQTLELAIHESMPLSEK